MVLQLLYTELSKSETHFPAFSDWMLSQPSWYIGKKAVKMTFKLASRILAFVLRSALLAGTAAGVPVSAADTSGVAAAKGDVPLWKPHTFKQRYAVLAGNISPFVISKPFYYMCTAFSIVNIKIPTDTKVQSSDLVTQVIL
jgi:hypothetical protein